MSGYKTNIERDTLTNTDYRKVIYTTPQMQLVLMSLIPGEDIPWEIHEHTTQFIRVESGRAVIKIEDSKYLLKDGDAVVIPNGTRHYVKNTGDVELKLYTLYSPPEHPEYLIEKSEK